MLKIIVPTVFIIGIFFIGCVSLDPLPIYLVKPLSNDVKWLNGQEFVVKEDSSYTVVIGFYRSESNLIHFDVEFTNYSTTQILIDPKQLYLKPKSTPWLTSFALDPEEELLKLQINEAQAEAEYQSTQINSGLWLLTDMLLGVADNVSGATNSKETHEEKKARAIRNIDRDIRFSQRVNEIENNKIEYENNQTKVRDVRFTFEKNYLRKTTLNQNLRVGGRVSFKVPNTPGEFEFVFPIGEECLYIPFNLQIIDTRFQPKSYDNEVTW